MSKFIKKINKTLLQPTDEFIHLLNLLRMWIQVITAVFSLKTRESLNQPIDEQILLILKVLRRLMLQGITSLIQKQDSTITILESKIGASMEMFPFGITRGKYFVSQSQFNQQEV